MANVTHEQEAGDTLHVATLEVAEELERTKKEQSCLQDDLDSSGDEPFWKFVSHETFSISEKDLVERIFFFVF